MWGLKTLIFIGSLWLTAGSGEVAGPRDCHLYNLSVPEGSSGHVEISIPEDISTLWKMQTATTTSSSDSVCEPILGLNYKGSPKYYNSTYQERITVSDQVLFTVNNASKWMAGEYKVITDLHETCLARINVTVTGPVSFPPAVAETLPAREGTVNQTGEGSSSNGSPEGEQNGHYGLCASLVFAALLAAAAALCVCWKRRREGPETHRGCEEEGISDSTDSPVCTPACVLQMHKAGTQDGEEIPLNGEMVQPREQSWLPRGSTLIASNG